MRIYIPNDSKYYYVDYTENGKRHRKSLGVTDKAAAELLYAKLQAERLEARISNAKPPAPFNNWLIEYANHLKAKNEKSFNSSTKYRLRTLNKHFEGRILQEITPLDIRQFLHLRLQTVKRDSVQAELNLFKALFNYAKEMQAIDEVPSFPKAPKAKERLRYLTKDEEKRLLDVAPNHLRKIITFALDTGGRKSEILNVDWEDIDLDNRLVHFRIAKGDPNGRRVPLTERVCAMLRGYNGPRKGPVFTYNGEGIEDPKRSFNTALEKADVENFRFHDLRHTYASRLVQARISLLEVQKLLGHKSLQMTERYSHLAPDFAESSVAVLNELNEKDD